MVPATTAEAIAPVDGGGVVRQRAWAGEGGQAGGWQRDILHLGNLGYAVGENLGVTVVVGQVVVAKELASRLSEPEPAIGGAGA